MDSPSLMLDAGLATRIFWTLLNRLMLLVGMALFAAGFHLLYFNWVVPTYGYLGFPDPDSLNFLTPLGYLCSLVPALWMPVALNRPSQFLTWMIYLTVFVPSELILSFSRLQPDTNLVALQFALLAGFCVICSAGWLPLVKIPRTRVSPMVFWMLVVGITIAMLTRVILVYWGNFHFVGWRDAYEIRFSGSAIAESAGMFYPINWLSFVFFPFLMTVALYRKMLWLFVAVMGACFLLYATQGMKHILFSGFYVLVLFFIFRNGEKSFGLRMAWLPAVFFGLFYLFVNYIGTPTGGGALLFGANVLLRVFANAGLLMVSYQNFFSSHPLTYYSHVTGINKFVTYPYAYPLGVEISLDTGGADTYNQNAGFWATDGLASIGLPGVFLISLIIPVVFYLLDCLSLEHRPAVIATCLCQYAIILANVSFFTSLITGGLFWFLLIIYLMPPIRTSSKSSSVELHV